MKSDFEGIGRVGPIAAAGIGAIASMCIQSMNDTAKYADEVERLSSLIGDTPEDVSTLIKVADNLGIPYTRKVTSRDVP